MSSSVPTNEENQSDADNHHASITTVEPHLVRSCQTHGVRFNIKHPLARFHPQWSTFHGGRDKMKPWADEVMNQGFHQLSCVQGGQDWMS
eukprot:3183369-Amphidinium_carterae.1